MCAVTCEDTGRKMAEPRGTPMCPSGEAVCATMLAAPEQHPDERCAHEAAGALEQRRVRHFELRSPVLQRLVLLPRTREPGVLRESLGEALPHDANDLAGGPRQHERMRARMSTCIRGHPQLMPSERFDGLPSACPSNMSNPRVLDADPALRCSWSALHRGACLASSSSPARPQGCAEESHMLC